MRCDSAEWKALLAVVVTVLLLYLVAWPIVSLVVGWRGRRLNKQTHLADLGDFDGDAARAAASSGCFLCLRAVSSPLSLYQPDSWFWFSQFLLRRMVILLVDAFVLSDYPLRVMLFLTIHFGALLVHLWRAPFHDSRLNHLETGSLTLLVLLSAVLALRSPPFSTMQQLLLGLLVFPAVALFVYLSLRDVWRKHGRKIRVKGRVMRIFKRTNRSEELPTENVAQPLRQLSSSSRAHPSAQIPALHEPLL